MRKLFYPFFMLMALPLLTSAASISGRIKGLHTRTLYLNVLHHPLHASLSDSIMVAPDGSFTYRNDHITEPLTFSLRADRKSMNIWLAPGYELWLEADAADFAASAVFTGTGAANNRFWRYYAELKERPWPQNVKQMDRQTFVNLYVKNNWYDSAAKAVTRDIFGKDNKDPYRQYFHDAAMGTFAAKPVYLLFVYASTLELSTAATDSLLQQEFPNWLQQNMRDEYVGSYVYCDLLLSPYSLHLQDMLPGRTTRLRLLDSIFTGKTHDRLLARTITFEFTREAKPEAIDYAVRYINRIGDEHIREQVLQAAAGRKQQLGAFGKGMMAPAFSLPDSSHRFYQLSDFKGKVVLLEFWASWCGPCKQAIPALKELREQYRHDPRLVVISIGVNDRNGKNIRYQMIRDQQMDWLQLEDPEGKIQDLYKALLIPRTVVIDPSQRIVDFDAPMPGDPRLAALIEQTLQAG